MDIRHARRAGFHNPCGFVTDTQKLNTDNTIFHDSEVTKTMIKYKTHTARKHRESERKREGMHSVRFCA